MSEIPPPTIPPATPPPPGGGSYTPPPPPPPGGGGYGAGPGPGPSGSSDRTLMIVLSYLGLLALIPYLTKKEDPEIHWHAKNGIGLLLLDIVLSIIFWLVDMAISTMIGCSFLGCILPIALLILHVYCIIQAVGGKRPNIPVVTDFAQKSL
jgi:uncharacterized membrane protein